MLAGLPFNVCYWSCLEAASDRCTCECGGFWHGRMLGCLEGWNGQGDAWPLILRRLVELTQAPQPQSEGR